MKTLSELNVSAKIEFLKNLKSKLDLFPFDKQTGENIKNSLDLENLNKMGFDYLLENSTNSPSLEQEIELCIWSTVNTLTNLVNQIPVSNLESAHAYIQYVLTEYEKAWGNLS